MEELLKEVGGGGGEIILINRVLKRWRYQRKDVQKVAKPVVIFAN